MLTERTHRGARTYGGTQHRAVNMILDVKTLSTCLQYEKRPLVNTVLPLLLTRFRPFRCCLKQGLGETPDENWRSKNEHKKRVVNTPGVRCCE
jgi:hypothetical protein